MTTEPSRPLAAEPHHDGSGHYVIGPDHAIGTTVQLRVRVPHESSAERVRLRTLVDAEPAVVDARIEQRSPAATWWTAPLTIRHPLTNYRFLLTGGEIGHAWLTEAGLSHLDHNDTNDFRLIAGGHAPAWLASAVGYEIFLDRFASSTGTAGPRPGGRDVPDWAVRREWHDAPGSDGRDGAFHWFGGDLAGTEARLDHLERLGVNLVYLTPFFPAHSTHRYDATTFDHVDPLLGGDDALASLTAAARQRGIRVIGDITLNHTGVHHEWFEQASRDEASDEREFYTFDDDRTHGYAAWHDVPSLPKLDHRSDELARRLYRGPSSTIARYLAAPFRLDGWRVDCANTTARQDEVDLNQHVASGTRATVDADGGGRWLVAEHCYDASVDLDGRGWHGTMAYQWISRPIAAWLHVGGPIAMMSQVELPVLDGPATVESIRTLGGNVPWEARNASMTMLDSHDSPRFRSMVAGDSRRHIAAMAALLTLPGVPTLFAGSEVGVEGGDMDAGRAPFPWDESTWDAELFDATRELVALRRSLPALQRGSMRWLHAAEDSIAFCRELGHEVVIVHLNRSDTDAAEISPTAVVDEPARVELTTAFGSEITIGTTVRLPGDAGAHVAVLTTPAGDQSSTPAR